MQFALRVVRLIALESGGVVRLLAVIPIPEPVCDRRGYVVLTTDQQIDRLSLATLDELRRMAGVDLDGVPVETSVIFGDRAVEIGVWNRTLPSTFVSTWWMWPLSTVTEPKRFREVRARSASSVTQPHWG